MSQFNQVLVDVVRKVMPNIIANDIVGVSPMTAPVASIFTLRSRYGLFPKGKHVNNRYAFHMSTGYHQYFTRINNRRKTQTVDEMRLAGYPEIVVDAKISDVYEEWESWLNDNLKYKFFYAGDLTCFFASESDRTMYLLRWT